MREDVIQRLASIGYTVTATDDWLLDFAIQKTEDAIRNRCNINDVPEALHGIAVDMAAGEFLLNKKASGQLTGFDLDAPAKQIKEGDISITLAIGEGATTPEQRLDALIRHLTTGRASELLAYRRLVW